MKKIILISSLSLIIAGCYNDKADKLYPAPAVVTCDTTTITYAHDIQPIVAASCSISSCHDAAGAPLSGNNNFTTFTDIHTVALNGQLLGDIRWESGHNAMPKGLPKFPDCDINKITKWVN